MVSRIDPTSLNSCHAVCESVPAQVGIGLRNGRGVRNGITLLEVMLALAILGVSLAILSQAMHLAAENGLYAEKINAAQVICESKMAEVVSGVASLQATSWAPVSLSFSDTQWYVMIQQQPSGQKDMIRIEVMVTDDPERTASRPVDVSFVRWIIDPSLGLDSLQSSQSQSGASSTGGSAAGTASGSSSTGGVQ